MNEEGLTLIEVVVMALIIAILIAIAIPTYYGAKHRQECRESGECPTQNEGRYTRENVKGFDCLS